MLISVLAVALLSVAHDPDAVIATAPVGSQSVIVDAVAPTAPPPPSASAAQAITPHGLTTDEQIDRWISQRATADKPFSDDGRMRLVDDRKMHGEVSAAIGTGDFSAYSASVSIPIGENGRVDLSYSQSKNGYGPYGYGYGGYGRCGYDAFSGFGSGYGYGSPYCGSGFSGSGSSATVRTRVFQQEATPTARD